MKNVLNNFTKYPYQIFAFLILLGHLFFQVYFFEPAFSSADAHGYFKQAQLIADHGRTWYQEESPIEYVPLHWMEGEGGRLYSRYPPGLPLIIALVLAGAAIGTIAPIMMAIPVEIKEVGPALTATAVGIIFMVGNTGGSVGPILGGKLIDSYGYGVGFFTMAAALIIAAFCIIPMRETGRKKHTSTKPAE